MKKAQVETLLQTVTEEQAIKLRVLYSAVVDSMKAYNQTHRPALLKAWKAAESELEQFCEEIKSTPTPAATDTESVKRLLMTAMPTDTIAFVFGVTRSRIRQLTKDGMPKAGHNRYNLIDCVRWYADHLKDKRLEPDTETKRQRARLIKARADKAILEVKEKEAGLIDMEEVKAVWAAHIVNAKTKLLSMPSKLAPILCEMDDPAEIQEEVKRLVYEILNDLAQDRPKRHVTKPEAD